MRLKFRDALQSLVELFILIGYSLFEPFDTLSGTLSIDPLCFSLFCTFLFTLVFLCKQAGAVPVYSGPIRLCLSCNSSGICVTWHCSSAIRASSCSFPLASSVTCRSSSSFPSISSGTCCSSSFLRSRMTRCASVTCALLLKLGVREATDAPRGPFLVRGSLRCLSDLRIIQKLAFSLLILCPVGRGPFDVRNFTLGPSLWDSGCHHSSIRAFRSGVVSWKQY